MPKVSVIMNCLNGAPYLREALDSVFAQTFQDWEIVFWDNGSTDNSNAIACSYGERVRCFSNKTTTPLGAARNRAFAEAQGEYIAILDVDDIWLPNKLERQLPLLENDPKVGLVFSNSLFFDDEGDRAKHFQQTHPHRGYVFGALLQDNFISSETMVFRRSVLERLSPLFDERFTMVMDYELSLRVALSRKLDYIDECLSKWRIHEDSGTHTMRFRFPQEYMLMLEKMLGTYPEIAWQYAHALSVFRSNVNFQLGLGMWYEGKINEARRMFKQCKTNYKASAAFLATYFMPFGAFDKLKGKAKNLILGAKFY